MKAHDVSGENAQPWLFPKLFAFGKQQLEAQADPQERFSARCVANGLDQTEVCQILHACVERADTREYDTARRCNSGRITRHFGLETGTLETLLHTA
jgi:hypothetical protein